MLFKLNIPSPHTQDSIFRRQERALCSQSKTTPLWPPHIYSEAIKGCLRPPLYLSIFKDATPLCFEIIRIHQIMALSTIYMHHPKKVQLPGDLSPSLISTSLHIPESVPMPVISSTPETLPQCPLELKYLNLSPGAFLFFLV